MASSADSAARPRRHLPIRAVLALTLAASASGAAAVLMLAMAWQGSADGLWIDRRAAALVGQSWSAPFAGLMQALTHLGDPKTLTVVGAAVATFLFLRRQPVFALGWLSALVGNAWLNPALKELFMRLRPADDIGVSAALGYSFPSGHSSGAMVTYGMFAYLVWRMSALRSGLAMLALALITILAVGVSRVYLQVHFLSDVLAGYASGAAWLALVVAALEIWRARQKSPSP